MQTLYCLIFDRQACQPFTSHPILVICCHSCPKYEICDVRCCNDVDKCDWARERDQIW